MKQLTMLTMLTMKQTVERLTWKMYVWLKISVWFQISLVSQEKLRAAEMEISTALWPVWLGKDFMFFRYWSSIYWNVDCFAIYEDVVVVFSGIIWHGVSRLVHWLSINNRCPRSWLCCWWCHTDFSASWNTQRFGILWFVFWEVLWPQFCSISAHSCFCCHLSRLCIRQLDSGFIACLRNPWKCLNLE